MSSGEADAIPGPTFGMSIDRWRTCSVDGCGWRAYLSLLCVEHGGRSPHDEYRTDAFGHTEWRRGYQMKVTSPTRVKA